MSSRVVVARMPKKRSGKRGWVLLGLLGFLIGTAGGIGSYILQGFGPGNSAWQAIDPFQTPFSGKKQVNILILGIDDTGDGLSDAIMLARIDTETNRIALVSVPRDSRVEIPGIGTRKINAAHASGGVKLTAQTLSNLLGVPIDYYMQINSAGLTQMVDALGGVEVDVEKRMKYDDNWGKLHINLKPGLQTLTGKQAVGYVRFRHDAVGDLGRMRRQQEFMKALARQIARSGVLHLPSLIQASLNTVDTDLSSNDLMYMASLTKKIDFRDIQSSSVPGEPRTIRGASFMLLDDQGIRETIDEVLYNKYCSVELVDATGEQGDTKLQAATRMLERKGIYIIKTTVASPQAHSYLVDYHDRRLRSQQILNVLKTDRLEHRSEPGVVQDFTVQLGKDFSPEGDNTNKEETRHNKSEN